MTSIAPKTILIIDDEQAHLLMSRRALRPLAETVQLLTASSLAEARAYLKKDIPTPDLFLVDLNLNNESGLDFFKLRSELGLPQQQPVIMVSTSSLEADIFRCYANGANCYIIKSANLNEYGRNLLAAVQFFLGAKRLEK